MGISGPRTTARYSEHFKATAVGLSRLPGVAVKDVAESLYIHPFMLSRWRKEAREGKIMAKKKVELDADVAAELKELRDLKKAHKRLLMEHDLLKKKPSSSLQGHGRHLCLHPPPRSRVPGESNVHAV